MTQDEKFNKVVEIMERSELDPRAQEHLRVFLLSMIEDPKFEKMIDLLDRFPSVFDHFIHCFSLKQRFFENKGDKAEWEQVLEKEKNFLGDVTTMEKDGKFKDMEEGDSEESEE